MKPRFFMMRHGDAGSHAPDEAMDRARSLTPLGRDQAAAAAERIAARDHQPSCVYSDDSARCVETAQIVAARLGFKPEVDVRLRDSQSAREAILDLTAGSAKPLIVTHDHVMCELVGDWAMNDQPEKAEVRRMKGWHERARY